MAYLQEIFKKLPGTGKGIKVGSEYLRIHQFADDIVLFREMSGKLKNIIEELNRESVQGGLKMKVSI